MPVFLICKKRSEFSCVDFAVDFSCLRVLCRLCLLFLLLCLLWRLLGYLLPLLELFPSVLQLLPRESKNKFVYKSVFSSFYFIVYTLMFSILCLFTFVNLFMFTYYCLRVLFTFSCLFIFCTEKKQLFMYDKVCLLLFSCLQNNFSCLNFIVQV